MLLIGCSSNPGRPNIVEVETTRLLESIDTVEYQKVPVNIKEKCREPDFTMYYKQIKSNQNMLDFFNVYKASYRTCITEITEWAK